MRHLLAFLVLSLATSPAMACETVQLGSLEISEAWSRASIGMARPGAFYVTIRNTGATDDTLTAITTPVSDKPMLHETVVKDGVASMPHAMAIPVPAGSTMALEPGGYHGMLMGLTKVLKEGEVFPVTLTFREAGHVTVPVLIRGMGARDAGCPDIKK
ncbi:MAG: hypothetical protein CML31_17465 [Rhizobiales bacterium]|jgi:hypothetical protein|nr:hypothetical protein [Hyphomicrobiales bacterium]|tara:strand:+ start:7090 stop:7563 length:474 start_codon:yes stop_codon:yes gene_type:complete